MAWKASAGDLGEGAAVAAVLKEGDNDDEEALGEEWKGEETRELELTAGGDSPCILE